MSQKIIEALENEIDRLKTTSSIFEIIIGVLVSDEFNGEYEVKRSQVLKLLDERNAGFSVKTDDDGNIIIKLVTNKTH